MAAWTSPRPQAPGCLCSISCCGSGHDDFSGLGRACRPRNGLNWMVLVSPSERTGKDYDRHAPSTVYPSFAAERGIRRVDRAENTCRRSRRCVSTSRRRICRPCRRRESRARRRSDPYLPAVEQWLTEDRADWRKQRHTATRIWEPVVGLRALEARGPRLVGQAPGDPSPGVRPGRHEQRGPVHAVGAAVQQARVLARQPGA